LLEKVEQVVRLIRSKGVGIYFCTQNPADIPDPVRGQLGNRVQHALRAFIDSLQNVKRVEVLPYHAMGTYKWEQLGIPYTLKDVSAPSEERVRNAEHILTAPGICPVERGA